jgi:AraC-like DNA-binding protein
MDASHNPPLMNVRRMSPSPALAPYIQYYGLREATLGRSPMYTPLPARTDCFLEIYLADRYRIVNVASGAVHQAPRLVLVGPHTRRREDLLLSGTLRVFHIHFTPVGFRALFGIPAYLVADNAASADAVLGKSIHQFADQLSEARDPTLLAALADRFLQSRLAAPPNVSAVARTARILQQRHGAVEIARLAAAHNLSTRQLERAFREHVGIPPKTFSRLARLNHALDLSRRNPAEDWAGIALAAGFYDQSHMVRDFRALTGETPLGFAALRQRAVRFARTSGTTGDVAFVLSPQQPNDLLSGA